MLNNYYHPTPKVWRKVGDTILLGCTSLSAMMMGAPLSETHKTWAIFSLNVFGVLGKMLTNLFKEDNSENTLTESKPE